MKISPHPEWATKFRKPGTELRNINGKYYLYECHSKYDKIAKKSKKITGKILGSITEDKGFIESEKSKLKRTAHEFPKNVPVREYGASKFIFDYNDDIIQSIKKTFPDYWAEIASMACIRLLNQSPIKNLDFIFEHSFNSIMFPNTKMNDKFISQMLRIIGINRESAVEFMKSLSYNGDNLLIDLTNVTSKSKNIEIAHQGYNSKRNFDPQINLMLIFSSTKKEPVFFRVTPGNIREVKSLILTLKESEIKKAILISDKGFYSDDNINELDRSGILYILPMRRNNKMIDYKPVALANKSGLHGYFKFNERYIWYNEKIIGKKRVIIYLDEDLKQSEEKDYLDRIEEHKEGYTFDGFKEKSASMGTISLLTSVEEKSSEEIYKTYKSRADIEQMIDVMKNDLDVDRTYMQNEEALKGWIFVNFIALIFHYRIYKLLSENDLLSKYSVKDFLLYLSEIKKLKIDNQWGLGEINCKILALLKKLKISIT